MDQSTRPDRRRRRRRLLGLVIGALGVVSLGAGQLSLAVFTDQETVNGTFSSGSVILDDVKIDALTLSTAGMVPGDTVTDDVVVENDGSVQLRYALSTASTNPDTKALRNVLTLTVKEIDATTPGTPCNDFDGVVGPGRDRARRQHRGLRRSGRRPPGGRPHPGCRRPTRRSASGSRCRPARATPTRPRRRPRPSRSTRSRPRTTRNHGSQRRLAIDGRAGAHHEDGRRGSRAAAITIRATPARRRLAGVARGRRAAGPRDQPRAQIRARGLRHPWRVDDAGDPARRRGHRGPNARPTRSGSATSSPSAPTTASSTPTASSRSMPARPTTGCGPRATRTRPPTPRRSRSRSVIGVVDHDDPARRLSHRDARHAGRHRVASLRMRRALLLAIWELEEAEGAALEHRRLARPPDVARA